MAPAASSSRSRRGLSSSSSTPSPAPSCGPGPRRCAALTWLWFGVFALRVAAQAPLWALGLVAPLGIVKVVLGLPLFAVAGWATWMGLRPHAASLRASGGQPDGQ